MSNKDYVTELSEELNQIYSHLGVEAFPNQQEEALKIIDNFNKKVNRLNDIKYKYSKLQEKYENLDGWHESVLQESLQFENELEIYKKALKLACNHIANYSDSCHYCPKYQYRDFFCDEDCDFDWGDNDCIDWLMNYFNNQAKEQLKDE